MTNGNREQNVLQQRGLLPNLICIASRGKNRTLGILLQAKLIQASSNFSNFGRIINDKWAIKSWFKPIFPFHKFTQTD